MNHRGHREDEPTGSFLFCKSLCVLCGAFIFVLLVGALLLVPIAAGQDRQRNARDKRLRYDLRLAVNFDGRTYVGTEQVHWVNHGDHATSTIFFHLYPTLRPPDYVTPTKNNDAGQITADEPRLDITEV